MASLTRVKDNRKSVKRWDELIRETRRRVEAAKQRVGDLQRIAADFEAMKAAGEPWPGVQELDRKERANG
jgi:hypothetical protein